jgi:hypothetical protein
MFCTPENLLSTFDECEALLALQPLTKKNARRRMAVPMAAISPQDPTSRLISKNRND